MRKQVDLNGRIIDADTKILSTKNLTLVIKDLLSQNNWEIEKFEAGQLAGSTKLILRHKYNKNEVYDLNLYYANIRDESRNEFEKKIQLGSKDPRELNNKDTIIIGVYAIEKNPKLEDVLFVGYPIDQNINYNTNPSIRKTFVDNILLKTRTRGFYFDKETRYVGFNSNFIFYYLDNFTRFHGYEKTNNEEQDINKNIEFEKIPCKKLDKTIQEMYFGAPGTGKSYAVTQVIKQAYQSIEEKDNPFVFKTTVFSDYSYYDFIGNIMPIKKDAEIKYEFQPGIFTQALNMAFVYSEKDIFLVVEEMSRGDIASIFGDIFQLLDRDADGISEYSINNDSISYWLEKNGIKLKKIYLPSNLHILGTVNTSDQNVNVIDTAFKRRFDFIYVSVDPSYKEDSNELLNEFVFELRDGNELVKFEWNRLYMALNKFIVIELGLSEDKQLGQFFIKFGNYKTDDDKFNAIKNKVLHYLWDDVQSASMNDSVSIFVQDITTFSELYKEFSDKKLVFSEEFLKYYK